MKKSILSAISIVLALVNVVLTAILVFTLAPAIKQSNSLITAVCEKLDLKIDDSRAGDNSGNGDVSISDLATVPVDFGNGSYTTTITLASDPGDTTTHYVKLNSVAVSLVKTNADYTAINTSLTEQMLIVSSTINSVVSNYTITTYNQAQVQQDILAQLRTLFKSETIYAVSISQTLQ